jgi:FtsP/CotA-like multicopper oxidase with cupredoxin domain
VEPADLPVEFAPADDLSTVTVDRRRTLVFTEEDKANKFFICHIVAHEDLGMMAVVDVT